MSNKDELYILDNSCHTFKLGDPMIKEYGKKIVRFEIEFNEQGEDLKTIIERTYRSELVKNKILTGGVVNDLQKSKIDATMQS